MSQGEKGESLELIKESLKVASKMEDSRRKYEAYSEITKALINQGNIEESTKVASAITNDRLKSKAYREISERLMFQGKKGRVNRINCRDNRYL